MCALLVERSPGPESFAKYGRMASSKEADDVVRALMARASRTIADLVRFDAVAIASSLANSDLESFTVIVGITKYSITSCVKSNTGL